MQIQLENTSTLILNQILAHVNITEKVKNALLASSLKITIWNNACYLLSSEDVFEVLQKQQKKVCIAIKAVIPWVEVVCLRLQGSQEIAIDVPINYILEQNRRALSTTGTMPGGIHSSKALLAAITNQDFPLFMFNCANKSIVYNYFPPSLKKLSKYKLIVSNSCMDNFYKKVIEHGCVEGLAVDIHIEGADSHIVKTTSRGCITHVKEETFEETMIIQLIGNELQDFFA